MTVRHYDAKNIVISVGGQIIEGFADGDFLTIETEDLFGDVVGSDGEMARSASNNRSATIGINVLQTVPANDRLSALLKADLESPNGSSIFSLVVRDLEGTSLLVAEKCWVMKYPDITYGREAGSREWSLRTDRIEMNVGSN